MKFELYQKRSVRGALQWRWRLRAANGKIVASSGEAYFNRADAEAAIELVKSTGSATMVEVLARPLRLPRLREFPR
jgi:uncharacterized protein YegP (UPF0339 family)